VHPDVRDLDALTELIDGGQVAVEVAATYPLAETARAWEQSQGGHTRGKIVITV
jgi:NADPH:quinone reductase-like Zn-dependent oxidoreductase